MKSDVFVFPTFYHNKTFGLVNVESMIYGLPIISTNEGGITDIIEDGVTGCIIERGNYKVLANKILEILNDDEKKAMGEYGRVRFEEKFTLEFFIQR
jgi:glycosyltransferase involved in cell wall biosynthesis